jgi:hydroxyacylglutathione hydrolase
MKPSFYIIVLGVLLFTVVWAAWLAPYLDGELLRWLEPHTIVDPAAVKIAKGEMVGAYFAVEDLGEGTFAIGEPRYYQQNYSYLIVGTTRAVLFDSGSGTRAISGVVKRLTTLPVTVIVSHLHFDHLGGIGPFKNVAMIDPPATRGDVPCTRIGLAGKTLGGRSLTVLFTPGHTPTSAALFDATNRRLFIGDFIYPTTLYAFLPGASLSAYQATAKMLLKDLPADTVLWTAHCCRKNEGVSAPWLSMKDLRDLDAALTVVRAGEGKSRGFYPRVFAVNEEMTLATVFRWNNR